MNISGRTRIMAVGLSAIMAVGVVGGAFALGPGGGNGTGGGTSADGTANSGHHHAKIMAAKGLLKSAASTLGMDPKDLAKQLKDGKTTIAAIATAKGVSVDLVINNAVGDAKTAVEKAVTDGKVTREQADKIESKLKERITKIVSEGRPHKNAGARPAARTSPTAP